jgi:hypothetical protein
MAPHWPDALDKLSSGMRTQMVENFARPALLASRIFPDNKQLHKVLYKQIQRHVFFNRQSSKYVVLFCLLLTSTFPFTGDVIYRSGDACNRIYFIIQVPIVMLLCSFFITKKEIGALAPHALLDPILCRAASSFACLIVLTAF